MENYDKLVEQILQEVIKRYKLKETHKKKLFVIGSLEKDDIHLLESIYDITAYEKNEVDMDSMVLMTELTFGMMGNLACGCGANDLEKSLLALLMSGKTVYVLEKALIYRQYRKTACQALYHLYSDYENKLLQYGVKFISDSTALLQYENKNVKVEVCGAEVDMTNHNVLLESDFVKKQIRKPAIVKINQKCIITPLAEDYIKVHNISIRRI